MTIYGITGQTGAGKSTLLECIQSMDGFVIDCDKVYWDILQFDLTLQKELRENFGDICDKNGLIDRKKLGTVVFSSTEALERLNTITHPYVLQKVETMIQKAGSRKKKIVAIDAISLLESGLSHRCDYVFAVIAPEKDRIARIMARDGISYEYAKSRALAQKNEDFYRDNAHTVLKNDFDSKEEFSLFVMEFFRKVNCQNVQT